MRCVGLDPALESRIRGLVDTDGNGLTPRDAPDVAAEVLVVGIGPPSDGGARLAALGHLEELRAAETPRRVLVATDDEELAAAALRRGVDDVVAPSDRDERLRRTLGRAAEHAVVHGRLVEAERRAALLFDHDGTGLAFVTDHGVVERCNRALATLVGLSPEETLGRRLTEVLQMGADEVVALEDLLRSGGDLAPLVASLQDAAGLRHWVEVRFDRAPDPGVGGVAVVRVRDVTALRQAEHDAAHRALHDALTGLPNRLLFRDRLSRALQRAERRGTRVALLGIDIDRFRVVATALGLDGSDEVLRHVGRRLAAAVRPTDTVARLGGDNFAAILEDVTSTRDALRVVERLVAAGTTADDSGPAEVRVTLSVGVSFSERGATAQELLQEAESAVHRAKERGGDRIELFDQGQRDRLAGRLALERGLRRALERRELEVHYQPIVRLENEEVVGVEALVRWRDPTRGLILPDAFVPAAEETRLIVPIGRVVLEAALEQVAAWRASLPGAESWFVAVNVSARQLAAEGTLLDAVREGLARADLPGSALHVELTERVLMEDLDRTAEVLTGLRRLGVQVDIDDFGTGYSSLAYLKRFPIGTIKIDRSFVQGIGVDDNDVSIVTAVARLAAALDRTALGEGVETEEQAEALRRIGLPLAQGYHWSPPLPGPQLAAWVTGRGRHRGGRGGWPSRRRP